MEVSLWISFRPTIPSPEWLFWRAFSYTFPWFQCREWPKNEDKMAFLVPNSPRKCKCVFCFFDKIFYPILEKVDWNNHPQSEERDVIVFRYFVIIGSIKTFVCTKEMFKLINWVYLLIQSQPHIQQSSCRSKWASKVATMWKLSWNWFSNIRYVLIKNIVNMPCIISGWPALCNPNHLEFWT